jgi:hypothetical protein
MPITKLKTSLALAAALGLGLAGVSSAAPYGGAQMRSARIVAHAAHGFRLSAPDLIVSGGGTRIHGSVCRTNHTPAAAPRSVRIEHLDGASHVVATESSRLVGNLSAREGLACAYYDVGMPESVEPGDTLMVCAAGGPDDADCGKPD